MLAFDTETDGLNPMLSKLVGISLCVEPGIAYYIPVGHVILDEIQQLPLEQVISRLKPLFRDRALNKIAHNGKFDMTVLAQSGLETSGFNFDSMIAAHLLGENSVG
jgi:DNA polymerase-1